MESDGSRGDRELVALADHARQVFGAVAVVIGTYDGLCMGWTGSLADHHARRAAVVLQPLLSSLEVGTVLEVDPGVAAFSGSAADAATVIAAALPVGEGSPGMVAVAGGVVDRRQLTAIAEHATTVLRLNRSQREGSFGVPQEVLEELELLAVEAETTGKVCEGLSAVLAPLFGGSAVGIFLVDFQHGYLQLLEHSFGAEAASTRACRVDLRASQDSVVRIWQTDVPMMGQEVSRSLSALDGGNLVRDERFAAVSLGRSWRFTGVCVVTRVGKEFTADDVLRLRALGPHIAKLFDAAMAMIFARLELRFETALLELARALAAGAPARPAILRAFGEVRSMLGMNLLALLGAEAPAAPEFVLRMPGLEPGVVHRLLERARAFMQEREPCVEVPSDSRWSQIILPIDLDGQRVAVIAAIGSPIAGIGDRERLTLEALRDLTRVTIVMDRYTRRSAELVAREERASRIRDLQTDVSSLIGRARLALPQQALAKADDTSIGPQVHRADALLARAEAALGQLTTAWNPVANAHLIESVKTIVEDVTRDFGLSVRFRYDEAVGELAERATVDALTTLCRVAREALVNAAKHAGSTEVAVGLETDRDGRLVLSVVDDGVGIPMEGHKPAAGRHGIVTLRRLVESLGGRFEVSRLEPRGTRVVAAL
ncbi:sensor histidine kinase [Agrococcus baldri]|uniref:Histidine kinase domain-containing protein n=1 Tax=Agrococcus baldri TaxID=153730 RepID=A0AA87UWP9_9MICO|nr:ATP-binding protein [Agrococcus baldri]GEK79637.1 hypothetical protein ABA31_09880 [Agrococcus baldri]